MKLGDQRASGNVEDRRGIGVVGGGIGIGGIVIAVVAYFLGFDPAQVLSLAEQVAPQGEQREAPKGAPADEMGQFVAKVLGSTETVWGRILPQSGTEYRPPTLVLYDGQVSSACGMGQAAMGPFYCPGDEKLYIDLAFFRDLHSRFGAPGDFAQAYVIAHEVGHHVQTLTGISAQVQAAGRGASKAQVNELSVRQELQADCFAGVWANHADSSRQILDPGDLEEALGAATAIGDDRLQKQTQGYAVPDSFTHGSSEQRVRWFRRGFESGDIGSCDTFAAQQP